MSFTYKESSWDARRGVGRYVAENGAIYTYSVFEDRMTSMLRVVKGSASCSSYHRDVNPNSPQFARVTAAIMPLIEDARGKRAVRDDRAEDTSPARHGPPHLSSICNPDVMEPGFNLLDVD